MKGGMAIPLVCLSHLRWRFVFQRPQHLMTRFAAQRPVYFVEEPVFGGGPARMAVTTCDGVTVVVPHLPENLSQRQSLDLQRDLLAGFLERQGIDHPLLWFYTPM